MIFIDSERVVITVNRSHVKMYAEIKHGLGDDLEPFVDQMCSNRMFTIPLLNPHTYWDVALAFSQSLNSMRNLDDLENICKTYLTAMERSVPKIAIKLLGKWKKNVLKKHKFLFLFDFNVSRERINIVNRINLFYRLKSKHRKIKHGTIETDRRFH